MKIFCPIITAIFVQLESSASSLQGLVSSIHFNTNASENGRNPFSKLEDKIAGWTRTILNEEPWESNVKRLHYLSQGVMTIYRVGICEGRLLPIFWRHGIKKIFGCFCLKKILIDPKNVHWLKLICGSIL